MTTTTAIILSIITFSVGAIFGCLLTALATAARFADFIDEEDKK